jgi:hypothetical protein
MQPASEVSEFLKYFDKVHQRTMNVVRAIPPDKIDWRFRPDKFSLGDLVRHIAASLKSRAAAAASTPAAAPNLVRPTTKSSPSPRKCIRSASGSSPA